jgi:hypothetical protein
MGQVRLGCGVVGDGATEEGCGRWTTPVNLQLVLAVGRQHSACLFFGPCVQSIGCMLSRHATGDMLLACPCPRVAGCPAGEELLGWQLG